jgi:hypothetical protein
MSRRKVDEQTARYHLIVNPLSEDYREEWRLTELRQEFTNEGYIKMPGFIRNEVFSLLKDEIEQLEKFARKRDFVMQGYETPRVMHVLGGRQILERSLLLPALYSHYELRNLIRKVAGVEVYPCLHPDEFMVANLLLSNGSTHGWHLDDPAYALILMFEAPSADSGGLLEFIRNWHAFCSTIGASSEEKVEPIVESARAANLVQVKHHAPGDAYLLQANRCLHRVTELKTAGNRRIALNFAYETTSQPIYGHTASLLYGDDRSTR